MSDVSLFAFESFELFRLPAILFCFGVLMLINDTSTRCSE